MSTREVTLDGGSPWGFRMHGGADVSQPLRISRVNPGSKAAQKGIREGDLISSINGQTTRGVTNSEAHALLRNAGESLTLGLNQECSGSPKRRAQRILEYKEDSTEKIATSTVTSTVTSTTVTRTASNTSTENNELKINTNGTSSQKDREIDRAKNRTAAQLGNGSSPDSRGGSTGRLAPEGSSSTATDRPQPGIAQCNAELGSVTIQQHTDKVLLEAAIMADNVSGSSRSRRQRRSRSNRKKSKKCNSVNRDVSTQPVVTDTAQHVTVCDNSCDNDTLKQEVSEIEQQPGMSVNYRVESPKTVQKVKTNGTMVKSRSLDDDEPIKITDVTEEVSDGKENVCESTAIVSEAESDVEWEVTEELTIQNESAQYYGKLSIISLPLTEHTVDEISHISPEEEKSLRDFLEGLNLVGSPEESIKRIEKNTVETVKYKKAKKRAAIAQHFLPYFHNPRYLDVISEEGSDLSDREHHKEEYNQSGDIPYPGSFNSRPLIVNPQWTDENDDVFEDLSLIENKYRNKYESKVSYLPNDAILVGTKLIDNKSEIPSISENESIECVLTTTVAESSSGAEIVFLDDSSSSQTPSDVVDQEEAGDADIEDEDSIDLDKSLDVSIENLVSNESVIIEEPPQTNIVIPFVVTNEHMQTVTTQDVLNENITTNEVVNNKEVPIQSFAIDEGQDRTQNETNNNDFIESTLENIDNLSEEIPKIEITSSTDDNALRDIMSLEGPEIKSIPVVTPPLITEKVSSENLETLDKNGTMLNNIVLALSVGHVDEIKSCINDEKFKSLPSEIKRTVDTVLKSQENSNEESVEILRIAFNESPGAENEDEFNTEFKAFCDELNKTNSDGLSEWCRESRPDSSNSDRSSRSTSQCTALYNPVNSSLTNIAAVLREGSSDDKVSSQPRTLRELCVQTLLTMPYGTDIIEELANVSLSIEEMTDLTNTQLKTTPPDSPKIITKPLEINNISCNTPDSGMTRPIQAEKWVGMPTEEDPSVLVCLSPAQKSFIDTVRSIPNEADSLLDLHRKYIDRRTYCDGITSKSNKQEVPIIELKINYDRDTNYNYKSYSEKTSKINVINNNNTIKDNFNDDLSHIDYNNYLKQFIEELPITVDKSCVYKNSETSECSTINYNNYIKKITREVPIEVEKQMHKPVNNLVFSDVDILHHSERLNMTRNDNSNNSYSNGTELGKASQTQSKIRAPMNKLIKQHSHDGIMKPSESIHISPISRRRHSLPHELYERQLQYILDKEREIEMEIEKLEEEKRKLEGEDSSINKMKQFNASNYQISRKRDIAILQSEPRPKSLSIVPGEVFRQKMYNEWIGKVAEMEDRKQHKVIKISKTTHQTHSESTTEVKHVSGIEDEFMVKVKERMDKLGLNKKEADENVEVADTGDKMEAEKESVLLMEGGTVSKTKALPKHLQEFVEYVRSTSAENGEFLVVRLLKSALWFSVSCVFNFLCNKIQRALKINK